jgi:hypothetical protein
MIEVFIILLKVLAVLAAFGGLMYLSVKYLPWPAPVAQWAQAIVGIILLGLGLIVMMQWVFGVPLG